MLDSISPLKDHLFFSNALKIFSLIFTILNINKVYDNAPSLIKKIMHTFIKHLIDLNKTLSIIYFNLN